MPPAPPKYWHQALQELSVQDQKLAELIQNFQRPLLQSENAFLTLVRTVIGQQISVKAATTVAGRLEELLQPSIQPQNLLNCSQEQLRTVGLSSRKAQYLHNVADFFIAEKADPAYWEKQDFKSIEQKLLQISGIGNWSIQMFAMFYLGEPDIFPSKDLGLIRAIENLYNAGQKIEPERLQTMADSWRPWRTAATWFLWRSIDPDLTLY